MNCIILVHNFEIAIAVMRTITENKRSPGDHFREMLFYNRRFSAIYWGVLLSYIVVKFYVRPFVLEMNSPRLLDIFVLSYPNFCEAVIGSFVVVNGLLYINEVWISQRYRMRRISIYLLGHGLAAVYVITQELKIHNLGGINVYDPNDVLFSVIGILASFFLLRRVITPTDIRSKASVSVG